MREDWWSGFTAGIAVGYVIVIYLSKEKGESNE